MEISDKKGRYPSTEEMRELLAIAFEASEDAFWDYQIDEDRVYFSDRWFTMLGYGPGELPHSFETWRQLLHPDDRDQALAAVSRAIEDTTGAFNVNFRLRQRNGEWKWILSRGRVVERDAEQRATRMVGGHADISRLKKAESELVHLAYHDQLTGLFNRKAFYEHSEQSLRIASRGTDVVSAILMIDLDNFKDVNDSFGHEHGDELLVQASTRLKGNLRESDQLFRLGGDEFTIVLGQLARATDAALVASNLIRAFAEPFVLGEHTVYVGLSVGISVYPRDGLSVSQLMQRADAALYSSKRERNSYSFYTRKMQSEARHRMKLNAELQAAIDREELLLYYQPVTDGHGRVCGAEALLRWNHPEDGIRTPETFIQVANESGAILRIGRWVLLQATLDAARWKSEGFNDLRININVSARQLRANSLIDDIDLALAASDVDPTTVELELTEESFIEASEKLPPAISGIRERGIRLAIDDFGTGYSSLSYLKSLPVNTLKIDRSFMQGIPLDRENVSLVRAIMTMAQGLDLCVVAEGVERAEQAAALRKLGCNLYQGFYFGKPMPNGEFTQYLRAHRAALRPTG
jgi:diguanylate cyclase (GGDEF)-like protein/PAS domain S-box-containing protein